MLNPALTGRLFIIYAFPGQMAPWMERINLTTTATPLQVFAENGATVSVGDLFLGRSQEVLVKSPHCCLLVRRISYTTVI